MLAGSLAGPVGRVNWTLAVHGFWDKPLRGIVSRAVQPDVLGHDRRQLIRGVDGAVRTVLNRPDSAGLVGEVDDVGLPR